MKPLTFATKLALVLCLPLAAVAAFGLRSSWEKWRIYRDYVRLEQNSGVLQQIGRTVHELQRERGRSAGFIGSKGIAFAEELRAQRSGTDAQLRTLDTLLTTFDAGRFGAAFTGKLKSGVSALGQLQATRQAVSALQLSGSESAAYYTGTIAKLLDVVIAMSHLSRDAEIANGISCYVNFLQGKEQAGIERATLTAVFTADAFTPETYRRFSAVSAAQAAYFRVFESFAEEAQREFLATRLASPAIATVEQMRERAMAGAATGKFGIAASEWFDASTARIDLLKQVEDRLANDYAAAADAIRQNAQREFVLLTIVTVLVIGLTLAASGLIVRSLTRRLRMIADRLAEGSAEVSSAATQVSDASQSSANGASEQAAALEETAASLEEIASMTRRNSEAAQEARTVSQSTHAVAGVGASDMDDLQQAMKAIRQSASDVAGVLKAIDEIAFQTNLLALNAAVEAARAGEAGAGFAIVASEVRTLAQRSADAARDTAEKIETATRNSERGVASAERAAGHFTQIVEGTRTVDKLVSEISSASNEQSEGIQQVNRATAQMDHVTQSTAATAEETAAQAEHLNAQAAELTAVVGDLMVLIGGRRARDSHGLFHAPRPGGRRRNDRSPDTAQPVRATGGRHLVAPGTA
jgi:methyl-accepting chemotaxis protein